MNGSIVPGLDFIRAAIVFGLALALVTLFLFVLVLVVALFRGRRPN